MKKILLIICISIVCLSCGKKGNPKYKTNKVNNLTVYSR